VIQDNINITETEVNDVNMEPCYVISVAARMVGLHAQTLRYYERAGLLTPSRSVGRQRLYSATDVERLKRIRTLTEEMGLNLAGVEVALRLMDRVNEMQREMARLLQEVEHLRRPSTDNTEDES
jgi:MerR family transcriptional regulator/heat shock protein HspR